MGKKKPPKVLWTCPDWGMWEGSHYGPSYYLRKKDVPCKGCPSRKSGCRPVRYERKG